MVKKEMSGQKLSEFEFPVEKGKIKEFANAICDPNPIYYESEYARSKGFADVLMPPTFPVSFTFHLPSENFVLEATKNLGMDVGKSVHGEIEFIYERPVCAGEKLRGEISIGKIYEKKSKHGGTMSFVEMVIEYFDSEYRRVVVGKNVFIDQS
ncbi:acyl dehydratase [Desulfosalsimonas propionicica]|uniref:Acyl dehydratase n=1 Tax=Desulfosalsimonas propionicica TaxID=332175 RepID=A0A7W0CC09_9BACT|nr:MaoC family dehydratase N-terminal domain-containing protein [Desulfosalsimonas propionicica]MBA2882982.1 acyl dehydratase [Desulfosalsimonas propionicica]